MNCSHGVPTAGKYTAAHLSAVQPAFTTPEQNFSQN